MSVRILVADDEETLLSVITEVLTDDGHDVTAVGSAEEALETFRKNPFPLVITDIIMGRMSGLELLKEVKLLDPEVLVTVMTSHASMDNATSALRAGTYDFVLKPFDDLDVISSLVNRAIEKIRLVNDNRSLMSEMKEKTVEMERLNKRLQHMVIHDGLTGLHNHRYFRDALEEEVQRSGRYERCFSLIFVDVDHFKRYNDTHGHPAGDEVLKTLARLLKEHCRNIDIAARYGGEEFVLLLPESDKDAARQFAERLRKSVEEHPFKGRETQPMGMVSLSLGVASFPQDGTDSVTLLAHADKALYKAKGSGRNNVCG